MDMSRSTIKRHIRKERERILKKFENNNQPNLLCEVENLEHTIEETLPIKTLREKLRDWYKEFHPTIECVDRLLAILSSENLDVPKSFKTLRNCDKDNIIIRTVNPGSYYHLGLAKQLKKLSQHIIKDVEKLYVDIGVDGLPLFKSSATSLWPIMGKIVNMPKVQPFLIGSYVGSKKPGDVDNYLHDFIYELQSLSENGICLYGKDYKVEIRGFICDTPARSFLCSIVGHTSYIGCCKCYQRGKKINNVVTYSCKASTLRTDDDFFNRTQKEFHKETESGSHRSLEKLGIKMISQFPLDPMHLVDLGVAKKIMIYLLENKTKTVMTTSQKVMLSKKLLEMGSYIPAEFQRKPRGTEEICRWKATEFRQLILYYGPVVLKEIVDDDLYYEILLLHVAYRLLSTPKHFAANINTANELLELFVENFLTIFGESSITFNVHGLLHLSECANKYGVAPNFSAYAFENFLQYIKNRIRCPKNILQQLKNMFGEAPLQVKEQQIGFKKSRKNKTLSYIAENFILTTSFPNNYCLLEPFIPLKITGFVDENGGYVKGIKFKNLRNFFEEPVASLSLGIQIGDIIDEDEEFFEIKSIYCKMVAFPIDSSFVLIPMLHSCQ